MMKATLYSLFFLLPAIAYSQIPDEARDLAKSLLETRIQCSETTFELVDEAFYDHSTEADKQEKEKEIYYFEYEVQIREDLKEDIVISIYKDLSVKYISGLADASYTHSPCKALPRKDLWEIASKNGLRTAYNRCNYSLVFKEEKLIIQFHESKSRWDMDSHCINANTGEYLEHQRMNVTF